MRHTVIIFNVIMLMLSGCATTASPPSRCGYRTGSVERSHFKGLDDEACVALYREVLDKSVHIETDRVAKEITVTAFRRALGARGISPGEIAGSSVRRYPEVHLKKWDTERLVEEYDLISEVLREEETEADAEQPETVDLSGRMFWSFDKAAAPVGKDDRTLSVIRLTALRAIGNELSRRDSSSALWSTAGYAAAEFTGVAAKIALMIASFMI